MPIQRNEILEPGQIITLYSSGLWYGGVAGYATLDKLVDFSPRSKNETWVITLPNGKQRYWTMQNPDKHNLIVECELEDDCAWVEFRDDEIPF